MKAELIRHEDENMDIDGFNLIFTWSLVTREIERRLKILKTCGPEDINKQCIHMANYLSFLWDKTRRSKFP